MAVKKKAVAKKKAPENRRGVKNTKPLHPMRKDRKDWDRDKVMSYLCDELATSSRGIGSIIAKGRAETGDFPSYSSIMSWLNDDEELLERYAHAKAAQADYMADEILEIADNASNDWMEREDPENPGFQLNGEHIQRSRVRIDTRKWLASKLKPKVYGDKLELGGEVKNTVIIKDFTGANGDD